MKIHEKANTALNIKLNDNRNVKGLLTVPNPQRITKGEKDRQPVQTEKLQAKPTNKQIKFTQPGQHEWPEGTKHLASYNLRVANMDQSIHPLCPRSSIMLCILLYHNSGIKYITI